MTDKLEGTRMTETLLLRPEDAGRALGIGRSKTYHLMRSGDLPVIAIGRSVRIPVEALRAWINERAAAAQDGNGPEEGTPAAHERAVTRLQRHDGPEKETGSDRLRSR